MRADTIDVLRKAFLDGGEEKRMRLLPGCCERKNCLLYAQMARFESKPLALPFAKKKKICGSHYSYLDIMTFCESGEGRRCIGMENFQCVIKELLFSMKMAQYVYPQRANVNKIQLT